MRSRDGGQCRSERATRRSRGPRVDPALRARRSRRGSRRTVPRRRQGDRRGRICSYCVVGATVGCGSAISCSASQRVFDTQLTYTESKPHCSASLSRKFAVDVLPTPLGPISQQDSASLASFAGSRTSLNSRSWRSWPESRWGGSPLPVCRRQRTWLIRDGRRVIKGRGGWLQHSLINPGWRLDLSH